MSAYYNENDPFAAAWLRELIKAGLIADGEVDERSIVDVAPKDLEGFLQCHFFAGIGGWSYALRLAGWPDDREVWTGSCPCQPWSVAGRGAGAFDPRDLWPAWFRLIDVCFPGVVFGEQIESPAARAWFDRVCVWLEGVGYSVGAIDLPAAASARHRDGRGSGSWQTPTTRDGKGQSGKGNRIKRGKNGRLHVANLCDQIVDLGRPDLVRSTAFRCWLMGYPESWEAARATAMPSSRKSRKSSSKPI